MSLRFFDWIWHIQGHLPLTPGLSDDDVYDRLDPLFQQPGTTYHREGDTLTFAKKDQAAQDKMSIFDGGLLRVEVEDAKPVLAYRLKSRALLTCFFAPLVFLAFAQIAVVVNGLHSESGAADRTSADSEADEEEDEEEEVVRLHPLDQFLGAPQPKQPGEDEDESEGGDEAATEDEEEEEEDERKHSPTPAYVFAGIFALIYLVGRVLEDWLIKRRFRRFLEPEPAVTLKE